MAMHDDLDEFPLYPSLRIPPLLDPNPAVHTTLDRPSPVEPNARGNVNIDNETAKLTGRRKALAEAKPLGDSGVNDLRSLEDEPRKKQKSYNPERIVKFPELIQLPLPKTKAKEVKPPPFQPISMLHELHEPPASAALFPPITPSAPQDEDDWEDISPELLKSRESGLVKKKKRVVEKSDGPPAKRLCLRPRMRWSPAETDQLVKGVAIYGMGKWKKILHHGEFSFLPGRTPVDLKDRISFRTCFPQKASDKSQASVSKNEGSKSDETSNSPPDPPLVPTHLPPPKKARRPPVSRSPGPNRKKARKRPWTREEDEALEHGYRQHGFQWTQMAKDPSLRFANRSGPQVRDRFRLKYASVYEQGGSAGTEIIPDANEVATDRRTSGFGVPTLKPMQEESEDRDYDDTDKESDDPEPPDQKSTAPAASKSFTTPHLATAPYGITGLLNDDEEDNRPSASLRWDENVTLAPLLLWEDMATRPMFDLE